MIAEAIAVGLNVKKAYKFLKLDKLAQETGVSLVDLYEHPFVKIPITDSKINTNLQISKLILDADCLINIPVLKTHVAAGITVSMKNLMGTISIEQKKKFHFKGLADSVVDLNTIIKPELIIVDGTVAGEGDGPIAVDPVNFRTLMAGTNSQAIDTVSAKLMGFEPNDVDMLVKGEKRLGGCQLADIEIVGTSLEDASKPFKRPPSTIQACGNVEFDCQSACKICSGVIETAMQRAKEMGIFDELKQIRISCGKEADNCKSSGKKPDHWKLPCRVQ